MRAFSIVAVALALCITATAADDKAVAADLKAMIGKWDVDKAELSGKDISDELKGVIKLEIRDGGKYTASHGEEKDEGSFTVDPAKKPKEMDVKPTGGPHKGKIVKAIYRQ